ncbi:hypothetical protein CBR_g52405 [Chara braunii]|uniref:Uncharacterized protein n=1 Tax=Chara braunii TaxID=69332 RepID=A0A388MA70_CHABU|nr:hypothetical protein CBR_g52405 [Chara braunii]|eukprot:GBG91450.1 hypothetical protein CBR_g52405 [Chara braunii]
MRSAREEGSAPPLPTSLVRVDLKSRSKGSNKSKAKLKRISSDDEAAGAVKQNLQAKMEGSSELADIKMMLAALMQGISNDKGKAPVCDPGSAKEEVTEDADDVDLVQNAPNVEEDEEEERGLAAYVKLRLEFCSSLHYTRVQQLCKAKSIHYFRKDLSVWELVCVDLQEYNDLLKVDNPVVAELSRRIGARTKGIGVRQAFDGLVLSLLDCNMSETWVECPKSYEAGVKKMILDNDNYEVVLQEKDVIWTGI